MGLSWKIVTVVQLALAAQTVAQPAPSAPVPKVDTVLITTTADRGPGSLRDALAAGNREIRLAPGVGGDVVLTRDIAVRGAFVILDGSANGSGTGLTLRGFGIRVRGSAGAHDVTLRNLRIRDADDDGIQIGAGAYNVVIENVSITGSHDGNLDITHEGTRDVVVRSSLIGSPAPPGKNMLFGNLATGIRFLGNVVIDAPQRNPEVSYDQTPAERHDAGTTIDMRHNVVWGWGRGRGTRIEEGSTANVIDNYFGGTDLEDALIVCTGPATVRTCSRDPRNVARAYTRGNVVQGGAVDVNTRGTETEPFPAPPVGGEGACRETERAIRDAGAMPRDAIDRTLIAQITPCSEASSSSAATPPREKRAP
ncbi:hypothetical protein K2Z84_27280 [Candidatus Binatia bacterium]|jgi:hypothetical protein|nr:hypothetical protein [Candidatus Binatia bacterium]